MLKSKEILFNGDLVKIRSFNKEDITEEYLGWLRDPLVTKFSNQRFLEHNYDFKYGIGKYKKIDIVKEVQESQKS